ncbi:MAG: hypothetical protein CL947_04810 [Epsilonproteobacteria bacterium]|nr:hypothetical protein [Campylobacterota bacterium]|tara:strand:- start:21 stop:761 length:741 start_codon:yes stop_codon:yes gene_type:complete
MSTYAQIQKNIADYIKVLKEQASAKYVRETLLGLGILASLFVGYFLYGYYVKHREEKAFGALIEVIEKFEQTQYEMIASAKNKDAEKIAEAWQDTEFLIDALYKQNMGSYLAPYFLMFKSQVILERDHDVDVARKTLQEALQQIPKDTALHSLIDLKRIKMSFDSQDEKVKKSALQDLEALSKSENGYSFQEACYVLGSYYLSQGDMQQAVDVWERMLHNVDQKALLTSPWVKQVEEKLNSIKHKA